MSGTTTFNPSLGSLGAYVLGRVDVRRTAILQEHLADLFIAANLVLQDWSNEQPLLFNIELLSFALAQGQQVVTLPADVIIVTDCYIQTTVGPGIVNNRVIFPVGRSEFASYPNPLLQARSTTYWFDRKLPPTLSLYPTSDGNGPYTVFVYCFRQSQDALVAGDVQLAIPPRWLMAFSDALARELSLTYAAEKFPVLAAKAETSYQRARTQEREVVNISISPGLSSYYGR